MCYHVSSNMEEVELIQAKFNNFTLHKQISKFKTTLGNVLNMKFKIVYKIKII